MTDKIIILDFGSQYAQIIARRVREAQVYCELFPWDAPMEKILSIVPIQVFGGLGVSEAASLVLFGLFGFVESELAAVLIGMRILFTLTNLAALLYLPAYALFFPPSAKTDP